MTFELIITRRAEIDLDVIFVWYEDRQLELGTRFIQSFQIALNKIALNPFYTPVIIQNTRSALIKKFPYKIFYNIDEINQQLRIIAVVHLHRNLFWIKNRLTK